MIDGNNPLAGMVALVTGAGTGNGKAIALRLAADGAAVAVNDLDSATAASTAEEIRSAGGTAIDAVADVADVPQLETMISRIVGELGRLDIVVNNAGLIRPHPFGEVTEADWDVTFNVNLRGLFFLTQAASKVLPEGGSVINISSTAGRGVPTLSPPYAASKAAVINLTQNLARALAPKGVRVNCVCPGIIDTDFNHRLDQLLGVEQQGLKPGEFLAQRAQTPLMK